MGTLVLKKQSRFCYKILIAISLLVYSCSSGDTDSQGEIDVTAPTQPTNLIVSEVTETTANLSWSASTDNIGVSSYAIYRNNTALTNSQATSIVISGLTQNTSHTFKVKARDAAGNESGFSNEVTVMTLADTSTLHTASGDLETYIGNLIDTAPGSSGDDYSEPTISELTSWNTIVTAILQNNINDAVTSAGTLGYQITEFTDTSLASNQVFYILEKKASQTNYWGTYVFSKTPQIENLILMAPHSKYDTNTGKEAVYCFKNNIAKALLINGTHRCNSNDFSSCSGTTSACGSSESYRISDMAHITTSMFQKTTENLFINVPNSVFIQLHGFSKQATDPYVIMSNGTRETPTTDYATLLKDALFAEDNTLTFKLAHIDTNWTRLIGFTNTQGRLINNSTDYCTESAITTSGRFIHVEQEKTKLRDNQTGWAKMSNALGNVF